MAKIQLANLQCESKLTTFQLSKVFGGSGIYHIAQFWKHFTDPSTSRGATINAVLNSDLPQEEKNQIIDFLWWNPGANIQIVAPL